MLNYPSNYYLNIQFIIIIYLSISFVSCILKYQIWLGHGDQLVLPHMENGFGLNNLTCNTLVRLHFKQVTKIQTNMLCALK